MSVLNLPKKGYVFWSGTFATTIINLLETAGVGIAGVLDWTEDSSKILQGHKVSSLYRPLIIGLPVFLAIHNPEANLRKVREVLSNLGFKDIYTPPKIAKMLHAKGLFLENYWLSARPEGELTLDDTEFVTSVLSDEKSRQVYLSALRYRETGEVDYLSAPDKSGVQYFPEDISGFANQLSESGAFVDVGAFDGDTLRTLKSNSYRPQAYIGLEPDIPSFQKLLLEAKQFPGSSLCLPLAASDKIGWANFSSNGTSSAIVEGGGVPVQTANLDFLIMGTVTSYIKMDIEGSELSALEGSKQIILRDKPVLAISVYHKPKDLTEIPKFIANLGVYNRFYVRSYGEQLFETVLYCLPD
jgi:FkbM family methyltransferase